MTARAGGRDEDGTQSVARCEDAAEFAVAGQEGRPLLPGEPVERTVDTRRVILPGYYFDPYYGYGYRGSFYSRYNYWYPGYGFGRQARRCALAHRYRPARDSMGQFIAAPLGPIRIRFMR